MKFHVVRKASYTIDNEQIIKFKQEMLEYYEEEYLDEDEELSYTLEDISDEIVEKVLADTLQCIFEDGDYYCYGIKFDDYFDSVSLDFYEEGVRECIREAVDSWIETMEETK